MLLFPILYISAFFSSLKDILKNNPAGGFFFMIFGLSIYNTSFSILYDYGFSSFIPLLQPLKELTVLAMLAWVLFHIRERPRLHMIDYCVSIYLVYTALYIVVPIGPFGFTEKLLAYKSTSFFCLIYMAGRLMDPRKIEIKKYFNYILVVAIAAAVMVLFEVITDQHFQSRTGYADYAYAFFGQIQEGSYGLTWTFERAESGHKRFASFFSDPLEHASSTLLTISVIAGLYTMKNNRFNPGKFGMIALAASAISVIFAISRSSMVAYFLIVYLYALVTGKKYILNACHAFIGLAVVYVGVILYDTDIYDFILSTITFSDDSGFGHVLEWIMGLQAMVSNPLGLGLGASGRVSAELGTSIGGENQFIIIGVQVGVLAMLLYLIIHFSIIGYAFKWFRHLEGRERSVALTIFLLKAGTSLPLFTANLDSYSYISYISWFLSGIFVNMIMRKGTPAADYAR